MWHMKYLDIKGDVCTFCHVKVKIIIINNEDTKSIPCISNDNAGTMTNSCYTIFFSEVFCDACDAEMTHNTFISVICVFSVVYV